MFKRPFSKRNKPAADSLSYEMARNVRNRIIHSLATIVNNGGGSMGMMFEDAGNEALRQYGHIKASDHHRDIVDAAQEHFMRCDDEELIDMLEWLFQSRHYNAHQHGVDAVNRVLREEGIGYEFSPYVVTTTSLGKGQWGGESFRQEVQHPEAIKKSNETLHATTVMPALQLLSGATWKGANEEMLKAHEHLRHGNYPDAILWAGKCLESVLKTICDKKKWKRDPKAALNALLKTCKDKGLFDEAYVDVIQHSAGRIRNTYSGHGQGPAPAHGPATFEMAEHMVQVTSAHVVLLAKLAGM